MSALSITHCREIPFGLIKVIRAELAALSMSPVKAFQASITGHILSSEVPGVEGPIVEPAGGSREGGPPSKDPAITKSGSGTG